VFSGKLRVRMSVPTWPALTANMSETLKRMTMPTTADCPMINTCAIHRPAHSGSRTRFTLDTVRQRAAQGEQRSLSARPVQAGSVSKGHHR
jgi:hypothetical protein